MPLSNINGKVEIIKLALQIINAPGYFAVLPVHSGRQFVGMLYG